MNISGGIVSPMPSKLDVTGHQGIPFLRFSGSNGGAIIQGRLLLEDPSDEIFGSHMMSAKKRCHWDHQESLIVLLQHLCHCKVGMSTSQPMEKPGQQ